MRKIDDDQLARLTDEIRNLSRQVAALEGERNYLDERRNLSDEIAMLKEQIEDYKIKRLRQTEEHETEKREVKHMVGLERKRQEFEHEQAMKEVEAARREAVLEVREANLEQNRKEFEDRMKFITERFTTEVSYLKEIMEVLADRLPSVNVELNRELRSVDG